MSPVLPGGSSIVSRSFDAARFNEIHNHPDVRPWIANDVDGEVNLTPLIEDRRNILLLGEHGGCLFLYLQPGVYEVHTAVLPEGRGPWMRALSEAVAWYIFTATNAYEVVTRVPAGHLAAKAAADAQGFRYQFTRQGGTRFRNRTVDLRVYSIFLQDWIATAPWLDDRGQWVHERMHAEAKRLGITGKPHSRDDNQNRFVGAVYEMARQGQTVKGVLVYNRWAAVCRQPPIKLVSDDPPTIGFDIGLMQLHGDEIEVIAP